MKEIDVYLFGQILGTHSFLLKDGFLKPDEYSEIKEQYFLPGGETGTAATVLNSLGVTVRIDGTWIGTEVAPMLRDSIKTAESIGMHFVCEYPDETNGTTHVSSISREEWMDEITENTVC